MSFLKRLFSAIGLDTFWHSLWSSESLKRRRDSVDDDEDDDVLQGLQTLSKRPRWMDNPKMESSTDSKNRTSPVRKSRSQNNIQEKFHQRLKGCAAKQNGNGQEVVEIVDDDVHSPVKSRAPLASLSVKSKAKTDNDVPYRGISSTETSFSTMLNQRAQKASVLNIETRRNEMHQPLFTTPLRFSKYSSTTGSTSRQTALNQTLKNDDLYTYSSLLAQYHSGSMKAASGSIKVANGAIKVGKSMKQDNHLFSQNWPLASSLNTMKPSCSKPEDSLVSRKEGKILTRVSVKPWKLSTSDDDIQIIEEKSTPRVNSLEQKLSENSYVSPDWVLDMKKRYSERERIGLRQVEEAKIVAELYAKHNQKHLEALDERLKRHLTITEVVLEDVEEKPRLPELTEEMNAKIKSALKPNPPSEVLVEGFGHLIKRMDIKTLNPPNWLNDEVINFYMNLIVERGKEGELPKVHCFNTFFYPKLVSQGYSSLRRWTKKVDIFEHDLLLVPIHLGMHWCMAAVNFQDCSIRYYDSMGSDNNRCLNALLKYLNEESEDKKKKSYDTSGWTLENVKDIPQQMNGSDCGVFSCIFAEYLSRNAKFSFSQKDMPYFRRKMVYEIITKQILQ